MEVEGRLSHDEFFNVLTTLLATAHKQGHGSVALSQKRLSHGQSPLELSSENQKHTDDPLWDLSLAHPLPVLVRATNAKGPRDRKEGNKVAISTVVNPADLDGFFVRYADCCKRGMEGLKKRDRSKKRKGKGKGKRETE